MGNILPFWLEKTIDRENGGFYGRIDGHGVLHKEAEKGAILNGPSAPLIACCASLNISRLPLGQKTMS